jgi:antitoxin CptB
VAADRIAVHPLPPDLSPRDVTTLSPDICARSRYINRAPGIVAGPSTLTGQMTGTTLSSAGLDGRRRRLLYRCWHRGTREMDLILGRFADATIGTLSETEIGMLEELSDAPDPDLYAWVSGASDVPAEYDHELMHRLRAFHHSGAA